VNTVMNLKVPQMSGDFLTIFATPSFSRKSPFCGVTVIIFFHALSYSGLARSRVSIDTVPPKYYVMSCANESVRGVVCVCFRSSTGGGGGG
jgi:hypothetical protein